MPLAYGQKSSTYRIESLPSSHLLKVLGFREGTQFTVQSKQPFRDL